MVAFSNHRKETIMAKRITDLMTHGELVAQEELQDEEFREEWARLAFARAVAAKVIEYRADHDLSQRDLAERIGLPQPQIARLEAAEHEPGDKTLRRLAGALGMEFVKSFAPENQDPKLLTKRAREGAVAAPAADHAVTRFSIA